MERIRSGDFDWSSMRPSFFDGFHRCLPVLAETGNNLIVDHIIESEEWMRLLASLLSPYDVFFVGVHCPLPELEKREKARGDRRIGEAREDFRSVHGFASYDLELDSINPITSNVDKIVSSWSKRESPSAFEKFASVF
jgi:chloramphenicol 3-O phosphotransferase